MSCSIPLPLLSFASPKIHVADFDLGTGLFEHEIDKRFSTWFCQNGWGSKAVWNFSENLSLLVVSSVPNQLAEYHGLEAYILACPSINILYFLKITQSKLNVHCWKDVMQRDLATKMYKKVTATSIKWLPMLNFVTILSLIFALTRVVVPLRPSQIRDKLTKPKFCFENEKMINKQIQGWFFLPMLSLRLHSSQCRPNS